MSQKNPRLSRRMFLAGAATAGAAAAGAAVLPENRQTAQTQADAKPAPKTGGGYHLSEHVKRYYKTTLV
ncbi:twin-arginine translocation signal domain-containing protein [Bordetella genomosp. 4]|uniref:Formate dehydrogenase n=1 Tax=Bordetella genomosp. 4 TaxID=463044 RepID=A0A261V178_9BORD|nr:twin-arginine translocation signal domain-containing protein [Bordetella genomosp. 4]OZI54169.1 formate dehydrogenase [Bordetella genomosp. 4]OZI67896.1 formate dehydrogenase [Bordetella genomosp. 4]